jgi:predicted RNA-binding Zn-ribbon protein involved in translation (DUF1610 family)
MSDGITAHTVNCTQCGGELHPDEGQIFLTCPFCGSTVYLDKSRVVFHWYLAPTLDEQKARGALARWMAGNETVKDLDQKSQVTGSSFEYFPLWYFKRRTLDDREEIVLTPAAATSVSEIRRLRLPAGDLRRFDESLESQSHAPTVPLEAAEKWLGQQGIPGQQIVERSLVHIPLYTFKYTYRSEPYTALVEGATGAVLANLYPAKEEAPYRTVGVLAALVFLCLATFPVIGALLNGAAGFGYGLLACSGAGLLAGLALFALAAWVAQKI